MTNTNTIEDVVELFDQENVEVEEITESSHLRSVELKVFDNKFKIVEKTTDVDGVYKFDVSMVDSGSVGDKFSSVETAQEAYNTIKNSV